MKQTDYKGGKDNRIGYDDLSLNKLFISGEL